MKKNHSLPPSVKTLTSKEMKQVKGGSFLGWRCVSEWRCIAYYQYTSCVSNCPYGGCIPNHNAECIRLA